jgi:hypothetical protein
MYDQTTGALWRDGSIVGLGYSGINDGLDNPAMQAVPDTGPIPVGVYDIGEAFTHPQCGPVSMRLSPQEGTDTFGRDGFLIHGDNQAMNHTASHGCIILPRVIREQIAASSDKVLSVVPD